DAGFDPQRLIQTIVTTTPGPWEKAQKTGNDIVLLGDVLFVRQSGQAHREVAGLLAALRKPARRTFTLDAPQHAALRLKLQTNVTVDFHDTPLSDAVSKLSTQADVGIRLDKSALRKRNLRERTPVSLKLSDQKLSIVLQALVAEWNLTWILRDGVLWITSQQ